MRAWWRPCSRLQGSSANGSAAALVSEAVVPVVIAPAKQCRGQAAAAHEADHFGTGSSGTARARARYGA